MARIPVTFTVDPEEDPDIAHWLDQFGRGEKSAAIREAIRDHIGSTSEITLKDIYYAVQRVERKIASGGVVSEDSDEWEEPDDITAALDGLGKF